MIHFPGIPGSAIDLGNPVADVALNKGLAAWWLYTPGYSTRGGNRWLDLCGKNHGTLTAGPTWGGALGRPGGFGALTFGSTHRVALPSSFHLYDSTAFSICGWVRAASVGTRRGIFSEGTTNTDQPFFKISSGHFGENDEKLVIDERLQNITTSTANFFVAGEWHWFGFSNNAGAWTLVIDGKVDGSGTYTQNTLTGTFATWGDDASNIVGSFLGEMDDLAIWKGVALSQADLIARYQDSRRGYPTTLNRIRLPRVFIMAGDDESSSSSLSSSSTSSVSSSSTSTLSSLSSSSTSTLSSQSSLSSSSTSTLSSQSSLSSSSTSTLSSESSSSTSTLSSQSSLSSSSTSTLSSESSSSTSTLSSQSSSSTSTLSTLSTLSSSSTSTLSSASSQSVADESSLSSSSTSTLSSQSTLSSSSTSTPSSESSLSSSSTSTLSSQSTLSSSSTSTLSSDSSSSTSTLSSESSLSTQSSSSTSTLSSQSSSSTSSVSSSSTSSVSSSSTSSLSSSSTSSAIGLFPAFAGSTTVGIRTAGSMRIGIATAGSMRIGIATAGSQRKSAS